MWTSLDPGAVVGITQENGPFAVNHFAFPWNLNLYIYYTILYHTVYITASSEMHSVWNVNLRIFLNIRDRLIYSKHMFCLFQSCSQIHITHRDKQHQWFWTGGHETSHLDPWSSLCESFFLLLNCPFTI